MTAPMRRTALRLAMILTIAPLLAGCDKCADYFFVNPFAPKPDAPHSCHEEPPAR